MPDEVLISDAPESEPMPVTDHPVEPDPVKVEEGPVVDQEHPIAPDEPIDPEKPIKDMESNLHDRMAMIRNELEDEFSQMLSGFENMPEATKSTAIYGRLEDRMWSVRAMLNTLQITIDSFNR